MPSPRVHVNTLWIHNVFTWTRGLGNYRKINNEISPKSLNITFWQKFLFGIHLVLLCLPLGRPSKKFLRWWVLGTEREHRVRQSSTVRHKRHVSQYHCHLISPRAADTLTTCHDGQISDWSARCWSFEADEGGMIRRIVEVSRKTISVATWTANSTSTACKPIHFPV